MKRIYPEIIDHVVHVPVDFIDGTLEALPSRGFDPSQRSLCMPEGLLKYPRIGTVEFLLTWIGSHAAAGSRNSLDQSPAADLIRRNAKHNACTFWIARSADEETVFGADAECVKALLNRSGFRNIELIGARKLVDPSRSGSSSSTGRRLSRLILTGEIGGR